MDVSKFKDVLQKLGFLRNYSALLLPAVIVLIAVLLFIPTQLMSGRLTKQIARESVSMGKQVESLSKDTVPRDQWKVEQEYQRDYQNDANQIALLARQSSQRELLSYKMFPKPEDISTLIFKQFGQEFRRQIEQLLADASAHDCPTEAEIQRNLQSSSGARPKGTRSLLVLGEVDTAITDVLCRAKAQSASFYANPVALAGYDFWEQYEYAGMEKAVKDCWYWQLGYWIIEDVISTIRAANSGSGSVFTSPVKRLVTVAFGLGSISVGREKKTVQTAPRYVLSTYEGLTLIEPYTGRATNDDIDVVHFNVVVVLSSQAVLPFMQELCSAKAHKFKGFSGNEQEREFRHNQITILESSVNPTIREAPAHNFYRYGEDAVVELDLICEYIFDKKGYDKIKPESVKKESVGTEE
jgi:hypothetical protein